MNCVGYLSPMQINNYTTGNNIHLWHITPFVDKYYLWIRRWSKKREESNKGMEKTK